MAVKVRRMSSRNAIARLAVSVRASARAMRRSWRPSKSSPAQSKATIETPKRPIATGKRIARSCLAERKLRNRMKPALQRLYPVVLRRQRIVDRRREAKTGAGGVVAHSGGKIEAEFHRFKL